MSVPLIPIGDKIIIRPLDPDEITSGGVILPDIAQEGSSIGVIVGVGPGAILNSGNRSKMQCINGDTVYYPKFSAHTIEIEDEDYVILREPDLFAIIPNNSNGSTSHKKLEKQLLKD